jgi:hypothetical protein
LRRSHHGKREQRHRQQAKGHADAELDTDLSLKWVGRREVFDGIVELYLILGRLSEYRETTAWCPISALRSSSNKGSNVISPFHSCYERTHR